jgi:stalled ribosome alternative rescue factor ArfA
MTCQHKKEYAERETQVNIALKGIRDGTYMSIDHTVKVLGVARTTLQRRMKGGKTRKEAREATQLLTAQDEKVTVDWISTATASGNPVTHSYIREMAHTIRASYVNTPDKFLHPCGTSWL